MAEEKLTLKTYLESSQFVKGASKVKKSLRSIGSVASKFGATLTTVMAVQAVKAMVTMSGEAEKTDLRMKRVFGSMSSQVDGFATSLSGDLGRVKSDIQSGLVSFQAFFQGLGFGRKQAAEYSKQIQSMSLDLASFFQIQDNNAQKRFLAALAGSPEVLDQFGINLKEARLSTELLSMGIGTTVQKTDELVKTTARMSVILEAMTANGILGDAKRTMDTYGSRITIAESSLKGLAIAIGDTFIPAATDMLGIVIKLTDNITKLFGTEEKLLDLNKEQQDEFKLVSEAIISSVKAGSDYSVLLDHLIGKYPKYLGGLDKSTMSAEDLTKRIEELNKAFELQNKIYEINNKVVDLGIKKDEAKNKLFAQQLKVQKIENTLTQHGLKFEQDKINGSGKQIGLIDKKTAAEKALNEALAEQIKLNAQAQAMSAFDVIYQSVEPVQPDAKPARLSDGGVQVNPQGIFDTDQFTGQTDMQGMIDGLIAQRDAIKSIKPLPRTFYTDLFNVEGFEVAVTRWVENGKLMMVESFDVISGLKEMFMQLSSTISQGFGSAVQSLIMGSGKFGDVMKQALKSSLAGMAADLAAKALYLTIMTKGFTAAIPATGGASAIPAASAAKSAGIFAAGALVLGGMSGAIKSTSSSSTGGNANSGSGSGTGSFKDFIESIKGEQVFRLAGNDLVTAINRTNTFQGTIGG